MLSALIYAVRYINGRWIHNDEGATAVEYGLLVAFIGLVIATGAFALGGSVNGLFADAGTELDSQTGDIGYTN